MEKHKELNIKSGRGSITRSARGEADLALCRKKTEIIYN